MNRFVQIHMLTSYPPSNLNRDDLGRPKTAVIGGATRLRISSQSLKRAWRTSELFQSALGDHVGTRTKEMGVKVYEAFQTKGVAEKKAREWARSIAEQFGKLKEKKDTGKRESLKIEQLAHFSPEEEAAIDRLVGVLGERATGPEEGELALLRSENSAADIAMFGRMLAANPKYNVEAAVQVAHAVTVHKVAVEDDFFTAVDDLNSGEEDLGAGHMGEVEFGAGLFYLYICVDRELLLKNLDGKEELARKTLAALIESSTKVSPTGKQNSFASRARASYVLCESGNSQPRSLSVAFLSPVKGTDVLAAALRALNETRDKMAKVYGDDTDSFAVLDAFTGEGSLDAVIACAME